VSYDLNRSHWNNNEPTDVDRWLEIYAQDDNLFWATDTGHLMNVIERLQTAKAQAVIELVARIEAAVILLGDDDITPTGRRMISKVLNPYRQGEEQ
jgi:hypothetical protein